MIENKPISQPTVRSTHVTVSLMSQGQYFADHVSSARNVPYRRCCSVSSYCFTAFRQDTDYTPVG